MPSTETVTIDLGALFAIGDDFETYQKVWAGDILPIRGNGVVGF